MFLGVGVGLVFFGRFLPMLLLYFGGSLPKLFEKFLLMSGLLFFGFVFFSFGLCAVVVCCFFKRDRSGSNRTPPTRTFFGLFLFSFCVPPHLFLPVLAVRPASCVFFGVPFWAPCIFGILLVLVLRPLFLGTRGGRGVPCFSRLVFSFPLLFCGHTFLDARVGSLTEVGERVVLPTPRPSGPRDAAFSLPPHRPTRTFLFFPAPGFFFQTRLNGVTNSECCYENSPELADGFLEQVFTEALPGRPRCPRFFVCLKGGMLFVFLFLCFCVWFGVFCRFYAVLLSRVAV